MKLLQFDTDLLPSAQRLPAFQRGAADFDVDAIGDGLRFTSRWQLLPLGDLNAIRSNTAPIRYRRTPERIEADGQDRVAIHYWVAGSMTGILDGKAVDVGPGQAAVWDLTRPIEILSPQPCELLIVTAPRHMFEDVLSVSSYSCILPPTPELALAAEQLGFMIDHAEDLPDEGAPYLGRALRDLFAVAMLPALQESAVADDPAGEPLSRRVSDVIDASADDVITIATIAATLNVSADDVQRVVDHVGGLRQLIERRRLLAAYRLLCEAGADDPISAIASRCGFNDVSRFSRRFRETFDASPSDLRRFRRGRLPSWAGAYHVEKSYGAMLRPQS